MRPIETKRDCFVYRIPTVITAATTAKIKCTDAESAIQHCLTNHKDSKVSILEPVVVDGRTKFRSRHFDFSSPDITCTPSKVAYTVCAQSITVLTETLLRSPAHNTMKTDGEANSLFEDIAL